MSALGEMTTSAMEWPVELRPEALGLLLERLGIEPIGESPLWGRFETGSGAAGEDLLAPSMDPRLVYALWALAAPERLLLLAHRTKSGTELAWFVSAEGAVVRFRATELGVELSAPDTAGGFGRAVARYAGAVATSAAPVERMSTTFIGLMAELWRLGLGGDVDATCTVSQAEECLSRVLPEDASAVDAREGLERTGPLTRHEDRVGLDPTWLDAHAYLFSDERLDLYSFEFSDLEAERLIPRHLVVLGSAPSWAAALVPATLGEHGSRVLTMFPPTIPVVAGAATFLASEPWAPQLVRPAADATPAHDALPAGAHQLPEPLQNPTATLEVVQRHYGERRARRTAIAVSAGEAVVWERDGMAIRWQGLELAPLPGELAERLIPTEASGDGVTVTAHQMLCLLSGGRLRADDMPAALMAVQNDPELRWCSIEGRKATTDSTLVLQLLLAISPAAGVWSFVASDDRVTAAPLARETLEGRLSRLVECAEVR